MNPKAYLPYIRDPKLALRAWRRYQQRKDVLAGKPVIGLPLPQEGQPEVVVSLTTYGKRLETVHLTIRSLMLQDQRPNRILLYLGTDCRGLEIPQQLRALEAKGLEIRQNYPDLKSHKKYYFAMQEFPEAIVVLVDDDIIYAPDMVSSLLATHERFPDCVIGRRCHRILFGEDGAPLPYLRWEWQVREKEPAPRRSLLVTTGAGSLYPPNTFPHLLGDLETLQRLALTADDIWLKALEARAGIPCVYCPSDLKMPWVIEGTQDKGDTLATINCDQGGNDRIFAALLDHFDLGPADFQDEAVVQSSVEED